MRGLTLIVSGSPAFRGLRQDRLPPCLIGGVLSADALNCWIAVAERFARPALGNIL